MRVVAVILFLALAAPAGASVTTRLNRLGDHIWGPAPCGHVKTAYGNPQDWGVPEAAAWSDPDQCLIVLDEWYMNQPAPFRCELWLHERGHIAGYYNPVGVRLSDGTVDHTHSPWVGSIMYPEAHMMAGWEGKPLRYVYHVDRRCQPQRFRRLTSLGMPN